MKSFYSLMFHDVSESETRTAYIMPSNIFFSELNQAKKWFPLSSLNAHESRSKIFNQLEDQTSDSALITLDDGEKSSLLAADQLDKLGLKGIFFIITNKIGESGFLNKDEILNLHQRGHIIGSHTHSHPSQMALLSEEDMLNEWSTSKKIIEELIGEACLTASVPGGNFTRSVAKSAHQAGYTFLFTSEPRIHPKVIEGILTLGRYNISGNNTQIDLKNAFVQNRLKRWFKRLVWNVLKWVKLKMGRQYLQLRRFLLKISGRWIEKEDYSI